MERRRDVRLRREDAVSVVILGDAAPAGSFEGRVCDQSKNGLSLQSDHRMRPGTMVRIDSGGYVLLGEVRYCEQIGSEWRAGIDVEHSVWKEECAALRRALEQWSTDSRGSVSEEVEAEAVMIRRR